MSTNEEMSNDSYRRNNEIFDEIIKHSPIGIAIVNEKGVIIDFNETLLSLLGYSSKEFMDLNFQDFTHPEDLKREWPLINELWEKKRNKYQIIKRYIHKNGSIIWVEVFASLIRDPKGNAKFGFAFVQDISEKIKAKHELQRAMEYYEGVVEDQTELIVRWRKKGILTFANRSYCEFFHKSREDLIGNSFLTLIPEQDRHLIKKNVAHITMKDPIASHEHRVIKPNGSIGWTEWINRGIFDEEGNIIEYQSVGRDITHRKRTEQELRLAKKSSEFYKDLLAHDMRNILHNMKMSIELLELKDIAMEENNRIEIIDTLKDQIERGASLISNIRSFSILEGTREKIKKSINSTELITKTLKNVKTRFKDKQIKVSLDFTHRNVYVQGGDMLLNAFENIIINAILHNSHEIKKLWISQSELKQKSDYIKFEFKDNGDGISDERKKILFERIYTQDKTAGGMGIGLSLVNRIIEKYDGKIWVEDRMKGDYSYLKSGHPWTSSLMTCN
ncbi:MAG: putative Histidine kinase [Promethearchaeota archaeon]|nr:MAG: putative Histidine kinase [Candidatus Lokiarchaeota archaeon]